MIAKLVSWLSKRFPEQLVVTTLDYTQLREEVAQLNKCHQGLIELHQNFVALEAQVKRLNDANGFVSTKKGRLNLER